MKSEQEIRKKLNDLKRSTRMMTNLFPDRLDEHEGFINGLVWALDGDYRVE